MVQEKLLPNKVRLSVSGLATVDNRLKALDWGKQSSVWAQRALVSISTLRRFRARQRITVSAFQSICQALELDWAALADLTSTLPAALNFSSVVFHDSEPNHYIEREDLLRSLTQVLQNGCRVLIITGITGIGKTVVAEQLTQHQANPEQPQLHLNFDLLCNQIPCAEIAAISLRQLGEPVSEDEKKTPKQLLKRWLNYLKCHPCWVCMNSVEQILQGDEETGWSIFIDPLWKDFFHQLLGEEDCQSKLILTSQDLPSDIELQGLRYRRRLYIRPLQGFSEQAQAQLFEQQGFAPDDDDDQSWSYLMRIGRAYEGHPLSLQVILGEIIQLFESNATAYWQTYGHEIEVVESAKLEGESPQRSHDSLRLDRYSQQLRKAVKRRIEETFKRLHKDCADAFLLLCTMAVYRDAMPESFLLSPMQRRGWSPERCQVALDALVDRYLLEVDRHNCLRQHPLIRSVALSYFDALEELDDSI